jgi:hypothetical protein
MDGTETDVLFPGTNHLKITFPLCLFANLFRELLFLFAEKASVVYTLLELFFFLAVTKNNNESRPTLTLGPHGCMKWKQ